MYWILLTIFIAVSALAEILLGNCHIVMPFLPILAFYAGTVSSWLLCLLPLIFCSSLMDGLFARNFPAESVSVLLILLLSRLWRKYGDLYSPVALIAAGTAIGILTSATILLDRYFAATPPENGYVFRLALWILFSGPIACLYCQGANWLAERLEVAMLKRSNASANQELPLDTNGDDHEI